MGLLHRLVPRLLRSSPLLTHLLGFIDGQLHIYISKTTRLVSDNRKREHYYGCHLRIAPNDLGIEEVLFKKEIPLMGDFGGNELAVYLSVDGLHGDVLVRRPIWVTPNPVNPLNRSEEI